VRGLQLTALVTANPQIFLYTVSSGARGGAVAEALRHKPEGRGIDSRWCHWNCSLT
jgi:hypothetical protein